MGHVASVVTRSDWIAVGCPGKRGERERRERERERRGRGERGKRDGRRINMTVLQ